MRIITPTRLTALTMVMVRFQPSLSKSPPKTTRPRPLQMEMKPTTKVMTPASPPRRWRRRRASPGR